MLRSNFHKSVTWRALQLHWGHFLMGEEPVPIAEFHSMTNAEDIALIVQAPDTMRTLRTIQELAVEEVRRGSTGAWLQVLVEADGAIAAVYAEEEVAP